MVQFIYPKRAFFPKNIRILERNSEYYSHGNYGYSMQYQGLRLFGTNRQTWATFCSTVAKNGGNNVQPVPPLPEYSRWRRFPYWARWLLGSILTVVPFSNDKWTKFRTIEGKVEMVVEEVESVVEIIEKTAKVAEKVSSDVANMLPENGKLKQTALLVENVSKIASQDAQLAIDFIHKVDELKSDIEDIKTIVEPVHQDEQ